MAKLSLPIFDILYVALFVVRMTKHFKTLHFRLVCLNGLTALISVKMIEMTFHNQKGKLLLFTDTEHQFQRDTSVFDSERMRGKM